ncbi:squalene epoxidase-domain-containing protein [Glomus cerebriforme]|uniref:Squalene monooxygenase n=1 Tax=Glomus cerebriforme TaxID=658196 RepID=A0A397T942_9GLOM|nr:squalene epoxidase-domain-containing protein [Glomus cerebriforme]
MSNKTTTLLNDDYELIIVGAGIAGSACAATFGKQGRKVLLIERDLSEPDRIVGELLQPGGVAALAKLGLSDCLENIDAIPCHGYGIFYKGENAHVLYPPSNGNPSIGKSFHHGRFIMNLRKAAAETPNVTIFEGTANEILTCPITQRVLGVMCTPKGQSGVTKMFFSSLTIVADGCFSKFRKNFISRQVAVKSHFVGFVLKDAILPFSNHGHVVLGKSPILMYQIDTKETRVLVDIPGKLPSNSNGSLKKYIENEVLPIIPKSVQPSFYDALQNERLRSMPNSFLPPSTNINEGLILLGDAMNMRHPLTGGGMTVAFNDVVILSDLLSRDNVPYFDDVGLILTQMQVFHWKRKFHSSTVINILAQALYALFAGDEDENLRILREATFNYLKLGGICASGPSGLLGGLIPNPIVLIGHFFAVAIYGIYKLFNNGRLIDFPKNILKSFFIFYTACIVIFPYIWSEVLF